MSKRNQNKDVQRERTQKEKPVETTYTRQELAASAEQAFKVKSEVVAAALKIANKKMASKAEAKRIVQAFLEKEVR